MINNDDYISILIPIYNGYEYFDDCIESILKQTYSKWELLLGINGHGDHNNLVYNMLKEKVEKLQDNRISIYNFSDIKGAATTINKLVSLAKYNWIAHIDIDDIWLPEKLEEQILIKNTIASDCGIIGTICRYFGDRSGTPLYKREFVEPQDFLYGNPLIHSSILIKKELANYTTDFTCYDYDCWIRNSINGVKIFNIPVPLVLHRIHKHSFFNASGQQDPDNVCLKYFGTKILK